MKTLMMLLKKYKCLKSIIEIWPIKFDDKIKDVSARADTIGNNECSERLENDMKAFCSDFAALKETLAFAALSK
jgi:hypothetical protein